MEGHKPLPFPSLYHKSASSELPVDSESNGWSVMSGSETTGGQSCWVHCRHGDDGALESPSALP